MVSTDGFHEQKVTRQRWRTSLLLVLCLFGIYSANFREIGTSDTLPASLQPITLIRGDGLNLDRFAPKLLAESTAKPYYMSWARGHFVSNYPQGPALLAVPLYIPQVWLFDRFLPGWDVSPIRGSRLMAKNSAAFLAAIAGLVIYHLLQGLGLGRVALLATLVVALGTGLWSTGSQSLWQHAPGCLALALALLLLRPNELSRPRLLLAGICTGAMISFRIVDLAFAMVITFAVIRYHGKRVIWFLPGLVAIGLTLLSYNLWYFGKVSGGQSRIDSGTSSWLGDVIGGSLGTLLSPNRGLFVFCPWIVLALGLAPWTMGRLREWPCIRFCLWALVLNFVSLAIYPIWWGGHSFGPRFWIDATPLFAIILGCGLDWALTKGRLPRIAFGLTIAFAVMVQAIGAFCYPSSWNLLPQNVDSHPARLWDWRDCELTRCLREGPHSPRWIMFFWEKGSFEKALACDREADF